MKKSLLSLMIALISLNAFSQSSIKDFDHELVRAVSCARGFAAAVTLVGIDEHKTLHNPKSLELVKLACVEDNLIAAAYRIQRNTEDAKTLEEMRLYIEEVVGNSYLKNLKTLLDAEQQIKTGN